MAVPGGRNGLVDDDDVAEHAEAFAAASDDEEVPLPPHLRALADAAQMGNVDALRAALGTALLVPPRHPLPYWLLGFYRIILFHQSTRTVYCLDWRLVLFMPPTCMLAYFVKVV
jgi:hypothetical protein